MAKKKFPYILIKDAKNGFRTQLVGGNGEPLMTSEVLESAKAVKVNLVGVIRSTALVSLQTELTNKEIAVEMVTLSWMGKIDIRYTGKSEAIYKMFKIEKGGVK